MKKSVFKIVRSAHLRFRSKPLPDRLGIYFHELEAHQWDSFREGISHFLAQGYSSVPASEFATVNFQGRRLFVSFDDNYRSWHSSLKVLDELGIRATFYVHTQPFRDICDQHTISDFFRRVAHSGEKVTLTRAELLEISAAGHEIGCHTHTHPVLSKIPQSSWDAEIRDSKHILEDLLQCDITHFSYPFGMRRHFSDALRRYCLDVGFRTIAAAIPGMQYLPSPDPIILHRSGWRLDQPLEFNLTNLGVDGHWFERVTGRSAVG
ncbi:MAG: polysaccharide deacetylase family protein [Hyphomicrobiaceae bacterium]